MNLSGLFDWVSDFFFWFGIELERGAARKRTKEGIKCINFAVPFDVRLIYTPCAFVYGVRSSIMELLCVP
jgi:hypothetical protein